MTYEQFWDGAPELAAYFRRADEIRRDRKNFDSWLAGMYIYDAILDASPILRAFAKNGTRPLPYPDRPYPITEAEKKHSEEEREKAVADKGRARIEALMKQGGLN